MKRNGIGTIVTLEYSIIRDGCWRRQLTAFETTAVLPFRKYSCDLLLASIAPKRVKLIHTA